MATRFSTRLVEWVLSMLLLTLKPSISQSISSISPTQSALGFNPCRGCTLNPAVTEVREALNPAVTEMREAEFSTLGATITSLPIGRIIFGAFSLTSEYVSNGVCVTASGRPISLPTAITADLVLESQASSTYRSAAIAILTSVLGFNTCENGAPGVVNYPNATATGSVGEALFNQSSVMPVALSTETMNWASQSPTQTTLASDPTTSPLPENRSGRLTTDDRVAVGIVVPAIVVICFLLGIYFLRRRQRVSWSVEEESNSGESSETSQPYLQQKAELEAEEKYRLELEGLERRHEINGEDDIHELPERETMNEIDTHARSEIPSLRQMHELRGEECSKELAAS